MVNPKDVDYELLRFVSKIGLNIVGGTSKLFKCDNFKGKILSHAQTKYSNGNIYTKLGFKFVGIHQENIFIGKEIRYILSMSKT